MVTIADDASLSQIASLVRGILTYVSYLVDPASGHMLVSKIKPCMSTHKRI